MAELGGFDANNYQPTSFDVLPNGEYEVVIVGSELKPTKAGNGRYLELTLQVLNGEYQNRKLFDRLNIFNPNQQAQDIARGMLSAICRAVGVLTPKDSSELHNKPLRVKIKVKSDAEYGDRNEITAYRPRQAVPQPAGNGNSFNTTPANATPW
ncbi:MAG: DUF669 domain-containing protein [Planctomycetota bacterium]